MSDTEKKIMQKLGNVMPNMSEEKKEYLLGVTDGIALMCDTKQKKDGEENETD